MQLKYQSQIDDFKPSEEEWIGFDNINNKPAFRWVFSDAKDPRNFSPRYSFPEILELAKKANRLTFLGWALSFFESQQEASNNLKRYTRDKPEMYRKLGTCIASGIINGDDGLTEKQCDDKGHYNHFEYKDTDFNKNRFEIVERLFSEV